MQDLFIEFLPPWVETGLQPAFYDRESGTVLQQTARMYAKINELVKAVNGMDKIIKEYVEYIDNYFKNLDVQEEINNKLDEMAESGDLATIIAQFIELGPVFGYDTIADMAESENLSDGCIARVLGNTDAYIGDGAFYKVRTKEGGETADGVNKVAIGDTLIAERIVNAFKNDEKELPKIPETFQNANRWCVTGDNYKYADPCIIYDKDTKIYRMYFWTVINSATSNAMATSSDLKTWSIVDTNVDFSGTTGVHKMQILVDTLNNPIKINNKYHAYCIRHDLHIVHLEASSLAGKWVIKESVLAPNQAGDGTDGYGHIAVTPVYDETNGNIILYAMDAPNEALADYGYGSRINRYISKSTDGNFVYDGVTIKPSGSADISNWYRSWIGAMQVIKTTAGLQVIFNAGPEAVHSPAGESEPSQIGMGYLDTLYSEIKDVTSTPVLSINSNITSVEVSSNWKGFALFNPIMNNWYIFYNSGGYNSQERITCAYPSIMVSDDYYGTAITANKTLLQKTDMIITNGIYEMNLSGNVIYDEDHATFAPIEVEIGIYGSTGSLGTINQDDVCLGFTRVWLGQYAWDNRNFNLNIDVENYKQYTRFYGCAEVRDGTGTEFTKVRNIRFNVKKID